MLKILRIIVISAALLASAVTSFAADEPCFEVKAECLEYIRELAEQGDAKAQFILGGMYHIGKGVSKDKREALRWYRLAAEQGVAKAQLFLGSIYHTGIAKDYSEALHWYRLAAAQGDVIAQYFLGYMYYEGEGVVEDKREAVRWYRLSAEQGHAGAQHNLGSMYRKGEGVAKDYSEALRWYRLSAAQGYVRAQHDLGGMYSTGVGVVVDYSEALRWYRLAAEQGASVAQYNLGWMYDKGEGVVEDKREALRWYRLAAEQGFSAAQYSLGKMYFYGESVVQEEYEAYIWFLIAKANGSEEADKRLQKIPWQSYLTFADIRSAKREAKQRFEEIKNRENNAQSSDNDLAQKSGKEFAIAKPPEETNIAAAVFENTWRSVVMIKNSEMQGSGVIIRPNMVATNCHVIEGGDVAVYKPENGRINKSAPFSAKVVYRKEEHDFCILEVKGLWGIAAAIRKYDTLKVGENVYALGAPRGLDLSLSNGLISQLRTDEGTRFIQTDAAISPGSSGGGLFDTKGNFIGILTGKYTDEGTEGIGFAIPADLVLGF